MDQISTSLNTVNKCTFHLSIVATMGLARKKMDRYYSLTDSSTTYRIAMVLHLGLKLEYFHQHEWEDDWIDTAEKLVFDEYTSVYEKQQTAATDEPEIPDSGVTSFGDLSVKQPAGRVSELNEYLRQPVESVRDPLKWWMHKRALYPNLSRMALDYLSIPGTSPIPLLDLHANPLAFSHLYHCRACLLPGLTSLTTYPQPPVWVFNTRSLVSWLLGPK